MSVAIRVEHLSKEYRLGVINHGMLYKDMQSWLARRLGRPDPHGQIGVDHFADRKDSFWALKDLNFDIEQGDRIGIIGRNGAGKSTLLKILSRITAPTEGTVKIKGRIASLLEVGTGFHGELTGRENIYLNGAILGMKKREIDRKIDEIIDFSEIEQHIDTPVKRYSSGMYVRLAFAVAAHLDSEILIADEVLAVGDAAFQKKALGKMNNLSKDFGRTVLFVSHNMNTITSLCMSGFVLDRGSMAYAGKSIDKVVSWYINGGNSNSFKSRAVWEDRDEYAGKTFFPKRMYLTDGSREIVSEVARTEADLRLVMEIDLREISQVLNFGIMLEAEEGDLLFWSFVKDAERTAVALSEGINRWSVRIPCELLRPGQYRITLLAGLHNQSWILPPEPSSPSVVFGVYPGHGVTSFFDENRPGSIAPILDWRKE
jgi:lipopolysaccharide transport system ATP-binding protein